MSSQLGQMRQVFAAWIGLLLSVAACNPAANQATKKTPKEQPIPTATPTSAPADCAKAGSGTATATNSGGMGGMGGMAGMGLADCGVTPSGGGMASGSIGSKPIPAISKDAVFVVDGGSAALSVIDPTSYTAVGTVTLTGVSFPHHINLSPTGDRLVVAIPGMDLSGGHDGAAPGMKGTIIVLDAKTGATLGSRQLDVMNHNGVFSHDGLEIWTSQMATSGTVLVLDSKTLATKKTIPVGGMPAEVTFSRDGLRAFVCNGESGTVTVIDARTKAVLRTINVGDDPVGAWPGSDGVMYVDNEKSRSVTAIDAKTLKVLRSYDLGFVPGMALTAANGELWVTDSTNGNVTYFMAGDAMRMGEIKTGAGAHGIAFTPDGTTGFVTNQGANTLSIIDARKHVVLKSIPTGKSPNGVLFRPK